MRLLQRILHLLLFPILSGTLLVLSFPQYDLDFLAWIALVPLLIAIREKPWKTAFGQGWLAGLVFFVGTLSWVITAMHQYGKVPFPVSFFIMLLLAGYCALFVGLFAAILLAITNTRGLLRPWTAAALWVTLEWLRGHLFSGFPWALLGYSQYHALSVIQIADVTGVYGVSFLLVLVNMLVARLLEALVSRVGLVAKPVPFPWVTVSVAAALVAFVVDYGYWRLDPRNNPANEHSLRIGLVQPNIDQAQKWDVPFRRETIDRYKKLTNQVVQEVDLVVWPEAATPFFFDVETDYREELLRFVRERGVPLLFGTPAVDSRTEGGMRLFNSAYLVSGGGMVLERYDKVHLVPFGEYVPLKPIFFFLNKLVVGIGDFVPGSGPRVMSGPNGHLGLVICFEVIFPDLVRQFVDRGANYMVTITNDAWFGRTSAPYQHFAMVVFRAVENRVPFARAANTGISGFIDAEGHILRTTELFVESALSGEVRIGGSRTIYTAYGDLFTYGCAILTLIVAARTWRRGAFRGEDARRSESPRIEPKYPF
ncbi:MAG TPA: apolipoprotein N-acyltransferase [Nitrospirales bacterium]|nr:apolipoprotein N-acyltransferase [Nitrospirales bacterium]